MNGQEIQPKSPKYSLNKGIALIPEDRKRQGVILNLPVRHNISLAILKKISRLSIVRAAREKAIVEKQVDALRIKTPTLNQLVKNLSGGNQQKVVLGKWMSSGCSLYIFDEPTRGIDVGAKQEIYNLMNRICAEGKGILLISSEMEEVIGMADRILVLCEGRMAGTLNRDEFSQEKIMALASGQL